MKQQPLGRSALLSSRLAYGCMRIAGTWERSHFTPELEAAGRKAVLTAYEAGYTHFDHADIYANGLSEEIFGRVLKDTPGMRDKVLIATKCGIRWPDQPSKGDPHRWDFSKEHILKSCEGSLKRMGIGTIDLFMLHRPDYLADAAEIAAAFTQLKEEGKVREFGVSNFRPSLFTMVQKACPMPLVCDQVEVHAARLDCFEDGTLDQCQELGVTPVSWSPLAGGMLGDGGEPDAEDPRFKGLCGLLAVLDQTAKKIWGQPDGDLHRLAAEASFQDHPDHRQRAARAHQGRGQGRRARVEPRGLVRDLDGGTHAKAAVKKGRKMELRPGVMGPGPFEARNPPRPGT